MSRLFAFFVPLCLVGVAQAMDVVDAPIPESNYIGITIFLMLMIGGCTWYFWMIMHKDKNKNKDH